MADRSSPFIWKFWNSVAVALGVLVAQPIVEFVVFTTLGNNLESDGAIGQEFDMIVLPGGEPGATNLGRDERVTGLLQQMAQAGKYTAAICAAPRVLAQSGLLEGRHATSYPGALEPDSVPGLKVVDTPVVIDGRVITSRGPGTAMDFALQLIDVLVGKQKRAEVEAGLQRITR